MTPASDENAPQSSATASLLVLVATPALFSTNIIFGRHVSEDTAPFMLAAFRWGAVALLLAPFVISQFGAMARFVNENFGRLVFMSFLGMGICGGGVYLGLAHTSATNATLIYSGAPVLIILLEWALNGRTTSWREVTGIALALVGIGIVVTRGSLDVLLNFSFNLGDLFILLATISWAGYSLIYRSTKASSVSPSALFALLALFGAFVNLPFALLEAAYGAAVPTHSHTWVAIAGIVTLSSLAAFSGYQYCLRTFGPALSGIFMYLMTPFGVLMALLFLGETFQSYHMAGIAVVMGGVVLATLPAKMFGSKQGG